MKTNLFSLIVISPDDPRIWKLHISRKAVLFLAIAFLLAFCVTVAFTQSIDSHSEADYRLLEAENRALKIENQNAHVTMRRLDSDVTRLDEASKRIGQLLESK